MIGNMVTVIVDRPKGSSHPDYPNMIYPINYGYIEGIIAPDGEMQDCYILGVDSPVEKFTGRVIAIVERNDDIEQKWIVSNRDFTIEEIKEEIAFTEQYFDSIIKK